MEDDECRYCKSNNTAYSKSLLLGCIAIYCYDCDNIGVYTIRDEVVSVRRFRPAKGVEK